MKLLKFYAAWCGPCKQQGKILDELADIPVESIDVDDEDNTEIVDKYNVRGLPTMILLDDSEEVIKRFHGLTSLNDINTVLKEYEQKQGTN